MEEETPLKVAALRVLGLGLGVAALLVLIGEAVLLLEETQPLDRQRTPSINRLILPCPLPLYPIARCCHTPGVR
jgi:hypothetical protein